MEDIEYFPQELHAKPKCLIALSGLDVDKKPFHASVLNAFYSNLRNDRLALRFRNLPLDHPYSKAKPKVVSCSSCMIHSLAFFAV